MQLAIPQDEECLKSKSDSASTVNANEAMNGDNCIEAASAMLAVENSLVMVGYRTRLPMHQSRGRTLFIVDEKTGNRLNVQNVPFLGALASRSGNRKSLSSGYFIADNAERIVGPGSKITVVVGELRIENVAVNG